MLLDAYIDAMDEHLAVDYMVGTFIITLFSSRLLRDRWEVLFILDLGLEGFFLRGLDV